MILNYVECIRKVWGLSPGACQCLNGKMVKRIQQRKVQMFASKMEEWRQRNILEVKEGTWSVVSDTTGWLCPVRSENFSVHLTILRWWIWGEWWGQNPDWNWFRREHKCRQSFRENLLQKGAEKWFRTWGACVG